MERSGAAVDQTPLLLEIERRRSAPGTWAPPGVVAVVIVVVVVVGVVVAVVVVANDTRSRRAVYGLHYWQH